MSYINNTCKYCTVLLFQTISMIFEYYVVDWAIYIEYILIYIYCSIVQCLIVIEHFINMFKYTNIDI